MGPENRQLDQRSRRETAASGGLAQLIELDLALNDLSGPMPSQLGSLSGLRVLDLAGNAVNSNGAGAPAGAAGVPLESPCGLDLGPAPSPHHRTCRVWGFGARSRRSRVAGRAGVSMLSGPHNSCRHSSGSLAQLRVLTISGAGITGPIPPQLAALGNLEVLHIDADGLTGTIPAQLGSLSALTSLHIGGGGLTGPVPASLGAPAGLVSLYVSAPGLSGPLPAELGSLTSLQTLWIKSESLTGTIPTQYSALTNLRTLYVSGGGLTGPIPNWITNLSRLQRLYLHNNALIGPIPPGLAALTDLTTLWLAGNDLRGPIHAAFGAAANLEVLDLRDNHLTWPPPPNLTNPRENLTALLPDTHQWLAPPPTEVTATAGDGTLEIAWTHPEAGDSFLVDTYTVNHRPADETGDFTQTTATASPATITELTNGVDHHIFITATNTNGTSNPSTTITATPAATATAQAAAETRLSDLVTGSPHTANITSLARTNTDEFGDHGVLNRTLCNTRLRRFCPSAPTKRWHMAAWLARSLLGTEPPQPRTAPFGDVNGHRRWWGHIQYLKDQRITLGCNTNRYCPNSNVTRGQMATFLVRAFDLPPAGDAGFDDVEPGHTHYDAINAIAVAGITLGCNTEPLRYCPERNVTKAQMATFITRACNQHTCHQTPDPTPDPTPTNIGGGTPTQPQGPSAPTIKEIHPGPRTLTVTWQRHDDDADRTITKWQIQPHKLTYTTNNLGVTVETATALDRVDAPGGARTEQTHTIEELDFNTRYRITVRGYYGNAAGDPSAPEEQTTDPAAVELVALEVTQGLQNWNGDITLVKGKRTVVRAFLEPLDGNDTTIHAELYAVLPDGTEYGPLYPHNYTGVAYRYTARPGDAGRRADLDASVNFVIDEAPSYAVWEREDWIGEPATAEILTGHGIPALGPPYVITYRLEVQEGVSCEEAIDPHIECSAELHFASVKTPRVRMVGIHTRDTTVTPVVEVEPTNAELMEQAERILSLMPIPTLSYELRSYNRVIEAPKDRDAMKRLLLDLLAARSNDGDTSAYLGVMLGNGGGRAGAIPSNVAVWYTSGDEATNSTGPARNRGPHEFGHVIGESHAAYEGVVVNDDGNTETTMLTICSSSLGRAGPEALPYPYIDVDREPPKGPAPMAAFLGPMTGAGDDDSRIWGLDTRFADGLDEDLAVINPDEAHSVMSYCRAGSSPQRRWVDAFYHRRFIDAVNDINWAVGPDASAGGNPPANAQAAFFGYVTGAADGAVDDVTVLPVFTFASAASPAAVSAGDYRLELLDANEQVLRSVSFGAQSVVADVGGSGPEPALSELWAVHVADPPDYASYRIWRGAQQILHTGRSTVAPSVEITSPGSGDVLSGATVEFAWTASDADGDALSYLVQYSTDGGATYETIAVDYPSTSLTLDRSTLAGSAQARLRVIASDGTRSTTAQSAVFAVAENPPQVFIGSPTTGAIYGGPRSIVLDASGHDPEDGALYGPAIVWASDIDGHVVTGARAVIDTTDLTAGTHVLTATATDSDNMTASASVTVTIKALNDAPVAFDDFAYATPGAEAQVDVAANDTDAEADLDLYSVSVLSPPAVGSAAGSYSTVAYTADAAGYDVAVYEVCDRAVQCATAELTVVVLDDT